MCVIVSAYYSIYSDAILVLLDEVLSKRWLGLHVFFAYPEFNIKN